MTTTVEAARETRYAFGKNWERFLATVNDERIRLAEKSLCDALGDIDGRTFLDIGSWSGLFSLAARNLGATVHSFDYDPSSVGCAIELRGRYRPHDLGWRIEQGSALDRAYMDSLGTFDVVYSWGVLHHTGHMWEALDLTLERVAHNGLLFIALYNDEGRSSRYWRLIKRAYNQLPDRLCPLLVAPVLLRMLLMTALTDLANGHNPLARYRTGMRERGMSVWHDWLDWIGGYPFEVACPGEVFTYLQARGFDMTVMRTDTGSGCNEYVARRR